MGNRKEVLAVVQLRMASTRLPGKAMLEIKGRSLLWWLLRQLRGSKEIARIVVATTKLQSDDIISQFCDNEQVTCYRGSVDDIVDRLYRAAREFNPAYVVRITADDIFKDPELIDAMINETRDGNYDAAVNNQPPTYPYGMDLDIVKFGVLKKTWLELRGREVTGGEYVQFITDDSKFKVLRVKNSRDLSDLRWTIDYYYDFNFAAKIIGRLVGDQGEEGYFTMADILKAQGIN